MAGQGTVRYTLRLETEQFVKGAEVAVSSFDKMSARGGKLADTMGKTATVMARSADTFGLPAAALRGLDDAMDITEIGLNNLSKAAVGFNAASIGVVGAGAAVGAMIGGLIRQLPGAADAYDALAASALNYFDLIEKSTGPASTDVAKMGAIAGTWSPC